VTTLRRVAASEGYCADDSTLERVAEACNADIRQMLNLLQMWRPNSANLNAADVSNNMSNAFKDVAVGAFDVVGKFFREANAPLDTRLRHYFVDSSMMPLLVQESYLGVTPQLPPTVSPAMQPQFRLSRVAQAAESIAEADVVGSRISREQQWGLAPLHGALACARPGFLLQGPFGRANFPSWLGRNSTNTKRARLLRECASHMQLHASGDKAEVRQAYVPALRSKLLKPLLERGNDGIPDVLAALDEYNLSKDDFDTIMELELLSGAAASLAAVPTAVKSSLTRKYNQSHCAVKKKLSAGSSVQDRFTEDDGVEDEGEAEADEGLVKQLSTSAKGKKAKNTSSTKGGKGKKKA